MRASYLLGAQGVKEKPEKIFPSLAAVIAGSKKEGGNSFKGSMLHQKLLRAVGGDKLDF